MRNPIFLDNNSTTPVDPRVLEEMIPYFLDKFGNASSHQHHYGWIAEDGMDQALERISLLLDCDPHEFIFTSGATESINLAIRGLYEEYGRDGAQIITCKTEHNAVLEPISELEKKGVPVTYLSVNREGWIDLEELETALKKKTFLVAVMMANNETGILHPILEISELAHRYGSLFFTDATQAFGKVSFSVRDLDIDLLACSAHKLYGPKGIGGLYIRRDSPFIRIKPQIVGGGQQENIRSGTLNIPGIVGFGKAADLAINMMGIESEQLEKWRNGLERELLAIPYSYLNGKRFPRLPQTLNIRFDFLRAEQLFSKLPHMALASGSACNSASPLPSHVLLAMGLSENQVRSSIRLGLGRMNTEAEIKMAAQDIGEAIQELRMENPLWKISKGKGWPES